MDATALAYARWPAETTAPASGGAGAYAARFHEVAELDALRPAWCALFDEAVERNPFYGPDYLIPLLQETAAAEGCVLCAVWAPPRPDGARRLAALLPMRHGGALTPARALADPMIVGGAPLLWSAAPEEAAAALLDALAAANGDRVVMFDDVRLDWPAWRALEAAAARQERATRVFDVYERAAAAAHGRSGPTRRNKKMARNLRRLEARLAEQGAWRLDAPATPEARAAALQALLDIEVSGWKGAAGTALASTPQTLALARRAYDPANTRPRVEFRTLTLDGAPIAACLNLVTRDNAAAFKCAYDERHARFSPGLVLDAALADEADAGAFGPLLDSVSVEGHPVRRLWVDGVRVGAGAISLAGGFSGLAGAILNVDRMRSRAWSMGRALYRRVSPRG